MATDDNVLIELMVVLGEVFGVMLLGFIVFRLGFLQPKDMKALSWFCARLALPSLLFGITATMDTSFNFKVVGAVFLVKLVVGFSCYMIPVAFFHGPDRFLIGATWMCATSISNDAAFGIPLVSVLYPQHMKTLAGILVGNCLYQNVLGMPLWQLGASKRAALQAHRTENSAGSELIANHGENCVASSLTGSDLHGDRGEDCAVSSFAEECTGRISSLDGRQPVVLKMVKSAAQNPMLVMPVLGAIYRFVPPFTWTLVEAGHGKLLLPMGLRQFVDTLKASFTALVLFQMGEVVEQNLKALTRPGARAAPLFLTAMKMIVTPALLVLVTKPLTGITGAEYDELQKFLVLYGLIPASEAVIIFTKLFDCTTPDTASVVLITHLVSAPLMFFSNVFLDRLSFQEWDETMSNARMVFNYTSLCFLLVLFVAFILMRDRWCSFPMYFQLSLASVLAVMYVAGQVPGCMVATYTIIQSMRLSADLIIFVVALTFCMQRYTSRDRWLQIAPWLVASTVLLPLIIYVPLAIFQEPRDHPVLHTDCFRVFPAEDILNPVARFICVVGTIGSLLAAYRKGESSSDRSVMQHIGLPSIVFPGEAVCVLGLLGVLGWLVQIILDISKPTGPGALFLIFTTAVIYNLYAPVQCLMFAFRGDVVERWGSLVCVRCCLGTRHDTDRAHVNDESGLAKDEGSGLSSDNNA